MDEILDKIVANVSRMLKTATKLWTPYWKEMLSKRLIHEVEKILGPKQRKGGA